MLAFVLCIRTVLSDDFPPRTAIIFPSGYIDLWISSWVSVSAWGVYFPSGASFSSIPVSFFNVTVPTSCHQLIVSTRFSEELDLSSPDLCLWYLSSEGTFIYTADNVSDSETASIELLDGAPTRIPLYSQFSGSARNLLITITDDTPQISFQTAHESTQTYAQLFDNFTIIDSMRYFGYRPPTQKVTRTISKSPSRSPTRIRTRSPVASRTDWSGSGGSGDDGVIEAAMTFSVGGVVVFIILALIACGGGTIAWLLWRRCRDRKRIRDAIAIEDGEGDAIPPVVAIDGAGYPPNVQGNGYFPYASV
jgi:hypothetical protein